MLLGRWLGVLVLLCLLGLRLLLFCLGLLSLFRGLGLFLMLRWFGLRLLFLRLGLLLMLCRLGLFLFRRLSCFLLCRLGCFLLRWLSLLLVLCGLGRFFVVLLLCERRHSRPEKQECGCRADDSKYFHERCLHYDKSMCPALIAWRNLSLTSKD